MTGSSNIPTEGSKKLTEYGNFSDWKNTVTAIRRAVYDISQKSKLPIFIATVSEEEFNTKKWVAMPSEMVIGLPDELTISLFNSLYGKFSSIDLYGDDLNIGNNDQIKQVIAVYRA